MEPRNPTHPHPYANRDLADLPGEAWRPVSDFEDVYEVSDFGRIRSLGRFYPHRQGIPVWLKPRILAQTYRLDKNERTGSPSVAVRAAFCREGLRTDVTVRRLVYAAFIYPDLGDGVVINEDGDGWNNRAENLSLVSNSEKGHRVVARGRDTNTLATIDRSDWPKTYGGYSRRKRVARCELSTGTVLAEYESIAKAVRVTGWDEKSIITAAKGRWKHYKGFAWKYVEAAPPALASLGYSVPPTPPGSKEE